MPRASPPSIILARRRISRRTLLSAALCRLGLDELKATRRGCPALDVAAVMLDYASAISWAIAAFTGAALIMRRLEMLSTSLAGDQQQSPLLFHASAMLRVPRVAPISVASRLVSSPPARARAHITRPLGMIEFAEVVRLCCSTMPRRLSPSLQPFRQISKVYFGLPLSVYLSLISICRSASMLQSPICRLTKFVEMRGRDSPAYMPLAAIIARDAPARDDFKKPADDFRHASMSVFRRRSTGTAERRFNASA